VQLALSLDPPRRYPHDNLHPVMTGSRLLSRSAWGSVGTVHLMLTGSDPARTSSVRVKP